MTEVKLEVSNVLLRQISEQFECSICEKFLAKDFCRLSCDHSFCSFCIRKWIAQRNRQGKVPTCPLCREIIHVQHITHDVSRKITENTMDLLRRISESSQRESDDSMDSDSNESVCEPAFAYQLPAHPQRRLSDEANGNNEGVYDGDCSCSGESDCSSLRTLRRQPSAPPMEDNGNDLPPYSEYLVKPRRLRIQVRNKAVYRTKTSPQGIACIQEHPTFLYSEEIKQLCRSSCREITWFYGNRPEVMNEVKDVAQMRHLDGSVSQIVCCGDNYYGLMHFDERGKFQYRVNHKDQAFCSVSCEREKLVALRHTDSKINVYEYHKNLDDDGHKPWTGIAFNVQHKCSAKDSVLIRDGCIYVLSIYNRSLCQYIRDGKTYIKYREVSLGMSSRDNATPKLRLLLNEFIVVVNWRDTMQLLDLDSEGFVDLPIEGANTTQPLDIASVGCKGWVTYPAGRNAKGVKVMEVKACL